MSIFWWNRIGERLRTVLFWMAVVVFSVILGYTFLKNDIIFTALGMLIAIIACINWPTFSVVLLVFLAITQPGLFNETLNMFRPFFMIAGASFLSWFLGFTSRKFKDFIRVPQVIFVLGLALAETAGTVHVHWMLYTIETFTLWIEIFLIYFIVANLTISERNIRFVLWATMVASLVVALYALNIYFFHPEKMIEGRLGSYGMYENANDLALIMVVTWPLIFKLIEIEVSIASAAVLTSIMLINTMTLVFTVSRGGLLGLVIVGSLCVWSNTKFSKRLRMMILGIGVVLAGLAIPLILAQRGEESGFDADDESASHRIEAWQAAGRILLAYPTGVGFNQYIEHASSFGGPNNLHPHNTPVKVAAEGGFVGVTCYLGMIFFTLVHLLKAEIKFKRKNSRILTALSQGLRISLIGFLVNTSFSQKEVEWVLYVVLGLGATIWSISQSMEPIQEGW